MADAGEASAASFVEMRRLCPHARHGQDPAAPGVCRATKQTRETVVALDLAGFVTM